MLNFSCEEWIQLEYMMLFLTSFQQAITVLDLKNTNGFHLAVRDMNSPIVLSSIPTLPAWVVIG